MKRSIKDKDFINIIKVNTNNFTKWTDQTLNWFIQMAICYRIINRKDGGPLDWLMASINTWLLKHLATSSMQMEPVWRKNKCGHWNHQTPAKVSNVFFSLNKFTRIIKSCLIEKLHAMKNESWLALRDLITSSKVFTHAFLAMKINENRFYGIFEWGEKHLYWQLLIYKIYLNWK